MVIIITTITVTTITKYKGPTSLPYKHPRSWNESWATAQPQVQVISFVFGDDLDSRDGDDAAYIDDDDVQGPEPERQQQFGREVAKNCQKVKNIFDSKSQNLKLKKIA